MLDTFLRFVFNRYRRKFYDLFLQEFVGEIPESVSAPAMTYLARGRKTVERWIMWQAYILQRRIVDTPKEVDITTGMLIVMKLLLIQTDQKLPAENVTVVKPEEKKEDFEESASKAIGELKEFFKLPRADRVKVVQQRKIDREKLSPGG